MVKEEEEQLLKKEFTHDITKRNRRELTCDAHLLTLGTLNLGKHLLEVQRFLSR